MFQTKEIREKESSMNQFRSDNKRYIGNNTNNFTLKDHIIN